MTVPLLRLCPDIRRKSSALVMALHAETSGAATGTTHRSLVHEHQHKDDRLAETVAADDQDEVTEADAIPGHGVEGDNFAKLAVIRNHPRVDPENIGHFALGIQLHGLVLVERRGERPAAGGSSAGRRLHRT